MCLWNGKRGQALAAFEERTGLEQGAARGGGGGGVELQELGAVPVV